MAERKPGPVKPPIIDLTARPADLSDEAADAAARTSRRQRQKAIEPETGETSVESEAGDRAETPRPEAELPFESAAAESSPTPDPAASIDGPSADDAAPKAEAAPEPTESKSPEPPEERATLPPRDAPQPYAPADTGRSGLGWSALAAAVVAGALVGTALTYALAPIIPLPSSAPVIADPADQLSAHDGRLAALEQRIGAASDGDAALRQEVDAAIARLETRLDETGTAIDAVSADIPAPVDLAPLEARLRTLAGRVDAIAAGASSDDAAALATELSAMAETLPALGARLDALEQQAANTAETLAGIETALAEPEPEPPAVLLAGVAANLEAAFAAGGPYAIELAALAAADPAISVPPALVARSGSGLPEPEALSRRFAALVPDMLAARRPDPDAGWGDAAADWLGAMLAMRPAGEVAGDSPDAVMSRLEAAMAREDFAAATALFPLLPAEMSAAAGTIPEEVAAWAEAGALVAQLRAAPGAAE